MGAAVQAVYSIITLLLGGIGDSLTGVSKHPSFLVKRASFSSTIVAAGFYSK